MFKDYYKILGISSQATANEIKLAYRAMSMKWHPDRNQGKDVTNIMQDINEAYNILKDNSTRIRYNHEYEKFKYQYRSQKEKHSEKRASDSSWNYDYDVQDEDLKEDINSARLNAKKLVKEFLKNIKITSKIATKGALENVRGYIFTAVVFLIIGVFIKTCAQYDNNNHETSESDTSVTKDEDVTQNDEMKSQKELGENKLSISIANVQGNNDTHGKDIADINKEVITSKVKRMQSDEQEVGNREKEVISSKAPEEEKVYSYVEQMPVFPGGDAALLKYITDHLHYPSVSQENGTQGKCMVRFVVTTDGTIGDVQLLTHVDTYCDREAVRVIKSLPKFIPGRQQGKAVNVLYQVPVIFELM